LGPLKSLLLLAFAVIPAAQADNKPVPLPPIIPDARLEELADRLNKLEDQSGSRGLLNLLNQVEVLKVEVARLRGAQEEMVHRMQLSDQRQKEVLEAFDLQIKGIDADLKDVRELAKRQVSPSAPPVIAAGSKDFRPVVDPEAETRAYEAALNQFKAADYRAATTAFNSFLDQYPASSLAGNAAYWLGLTFFSTGDHKNAAAAQRRLLKDYPLHPKTPDAMVNLARAQIQLGETESARQNLEQVIARYPTSRSAELAKKILSLLK
jgi:tol-pal system protein YbgF